MLPFNYFRKYISKIPTSPDNCSMVPVPCFWGHVRYIFVFFSLLVVRFKDVVLFIRIVMEYAEFHALTLYFHLD